MTEENRPDNMESILRRIQKLLAIAEDGRGDANEAAAAASQAEKLMRKFQLDHADVLVAEMKRGEGVAEDYVIGEMKPEGKGRADNPMSKNPPWAQHLAVAIARLNDCEVRQTTRPNVYGAPSAAISFYGMKADVQVCTWMFRYVLNSCIAFVRSYQSDYRKQHGVAPDKVSSHSYRKGFIAVVTSRLYRLGEEKKAEQQASAASGSRALVLVDAKKRAITEAFGDFGYKQSKGSEVRDRDAFARGAAAGRSVDLNSRGIGGPSDGEDIKRLR